MGVTAQRFRASVARLVSHFGEGGTVTVRRRHSLVDPSTGGIVTALEVDGAAPAGAVVLDLDAIYLQGTLTAGVRLTIAGDSTVYEVGAAVTAAGNRLAGVTVFPGLATAAANDAAVAIVQGYRDFDLPAVVARYAEDLVDGSRIRSEDRLIVVDLTSAVVVPVVSDVLVIAGEVFHVLDIGVVDGGGGRVTLRIQAGVR